MTTAEIPLPRPPWRQRIIEGATPYVLIMPKVAFFATFLLFPVGWAILLTLQGGSALRGLRFVGLKNYFKFLGDKLFWISLKNSFQYTVMVIPAVLVITMYLAALLNRNIRFRNFFRFALIPPAVTSGVAASVIWVYLFHGKEGLFNEILKALGYRPVLWLGTPSLVIPIIVALEAWRGTGFYTMLFYAAMQNIPQHLYDAAAIDGATGFQAFRLITLPLMKPVLMFATVMATVWNLQVFDPVYVLTGGGPGFSSYTVVFYVYRTAFTFDNMGFAATMSFVLLLIILALTMVQLTLFRTEVEF